MTEGTLGATPIHFGPEGSARFGWLHPPEGLSRATGVVLCNPIGDDYVRAHRALRRLAETLARGGFFVLRFDFHGTGDSSGSERDPGRVEAWLADVPLAVEELRARSGAAKIAIVGLRLGGTIAMAACAAPGRAPAPVDDLVLWSPYTTGALYVRETTRLHKMHRMLEPGAFACEPPGWDGGGQEALGFLLTPETVSDLERVDLFASTTPAARRTLVIGSGDVPVEDKLLAHLGALGGDVDYRHLPGQSFLVQINHKSDLPTASIDAITTWLSDHHPRGVAAETPVPRAMRAAPYDEEPMVFGRTHPLFGILVHPPKHEKDPKRPAILMTNAGCVHRIGTHRSYVSMARRWAELGFWVLRLDLSGIGDSPAAPGCPENLTYPEHGLEDLDDAMTAVANATGVEKFIVLGLCSGGDLAFQIGFKDRRVAGVVMINPRTFCVHDLEMVETYKRARYYQESLFRLASWTKALRGEVNWRRAIRLVVPKVKNIALRRLQRLMPSSRTRQNGSQQEAVTNDVPACLRMMAERGVDTFLVVSENDPGVDYVDALFGKAMESLRAVRGFRRENFLGTDHTFTSLYAQKLVSQVITDHLVAHHDVARSDSPALPA